MSVTLLVLVVSLGLVVASERAGWIPAKALVEQPKWSSLYTTTPTVVDLLLHTQDLVGTFNLPPTDLSLMYTIDSRVIS
jgi:hypothetical protein